jgi:hypothetical protein
MAELVVSIDGVETQHVHVQKERTTIGRRHHNDVALSDLSVSGTHCVLEREGAAGGVWVKDLNSTNGTFLNGERVQRHRLEDQDVLSIGIYRVQYLATPAPADMGHTSPMKLEDLGAPGTAGAMHASLLVLSGTSAGLEVPLVKTVTTFGKPGVAVLAISHRRHGYFAARVEGGDQPALLNGRPLGAVAQPLSDQDMLELAGTAMRFVLG